MYKFIISSTESKNYLKGHTKEICFIGRSNVGKSTLINSITNQKGLARTSNTPGRTQLINFFQDDNKRTIVDLPGYGYARMPKKEKLKMINMVDEYLSTRKELIRTIVLIDSKIGPTKDDIQMLKNLININRKIFVVLTKSDKSKQSELYKTKQELVKFTNNYIIISMLKNKNINKFKKIVNSFFKKG